MLDSLPQFRRRLLNWYDRAKRDLPWRAAARQGTTPGRVDPYLVLVSELMLQQTQVATVIPYFRKFVERFPGANDLAGADEQEVLRLWQGLGYYSRARNLHKAAKKIVQDFGGRVPEGLDEIRSLPGVGRYTAGAIASIAFEQRVPILDGNVMRVLCRLDKIESDPRDPATQERLWARAGEILPESRLGDFNSALMELGALVCTPRNPQCLLCPVRDQCDAFAAGIAEKIPAPRKAKVSPLSKRWTFCIRRGNQWLIEQRPSRGRWAGLWQFVTIEAAKSSPSAKSVAGKLPVGILALKRIGVVTHALTHRRYQFDVFVCDAVGDAPMISDRPRHWVAADMLGNYPLPRPHLKIVAMLGEAATKAPRE